MQETHAGRQGAGGSFGTVRELYGRLVTQRAIVLLVLAAAVGLEYYLANVPVADLSETSKFSPAKVMAAEQVVEFTNPETDPGHFAFTYKQPVESQKQRMLVDAYFDKATLSDETVQRLAALGAQAPGDADAIRYLTSVSGGGVCSTAIHVQAAGSRDWVRFSQNSVANSDRRRLLGITMNGVDSVVTISSKGAFENAGQSPCQVDLHVGDWEKKTAGFLPIQVRVPAGSGFRFQWEASDVRPEGWPTSGSPRALLEFGDAGGQSFHATEIKIVPAKPSAGSLEHSLVAQAERRADPLSVDSLLIGTDQLQITASGKGRVLKDGKVITTLNFLESINKYPLIAALFAAANLGLLNWAKRKFFPPTGDKEKAVVLFPEKKPDDAETKARSQAAG